MTNVYTGGSPEERELANLRKHVSKNGAEPTELLERVRRIESILEALTAAKMGFAPLTQKHVAKAVEIALHDTRCALAYADHLVNRDEGFL